MKVICAGMPKTGTKSMANALRALGYSVNDAFEEMLHNSDRWIEIFDGKHDNSVFKEMYSDIDAVTDLPAVAMWDQILEAFPDSKVILMKRGSEEEWLKSFKTTFYHVPSFTFKSPNFFMYHTICRTISPIVYKGWIVMRKAREACFGFFACTYYKNDMLARSAYRRHEAYVRSMCREGQLLEYNIREGWEPLCRFLDKPHPKIQFPHLNKKAEIIDGTLGEDNIELYYKTATDEIKRRVPLMVLAALLFIICMVWCFG